MRERVAVLRDRVPCLVEVVVARRIAHRKAGVRAARDVADRADHPCGQHDGTRDRWQLVDDLLDGDDRSRRRPAPLPSARRACPRSARCRARSARWAWMMPTSGFMRRHGRQHLARERALDRLDRAGVLRQVGADVAAQDRRTAARRRRPRNGWPCRRGCAPRSPAGAASRSRRRRGTGAANRRRGCRPTRTSACATQPVPISWSYTMSGVMRTRCRSRRPWRMISCAGGVGDEVGEALERQRVAVVHVLGDGLDADAVVTHRGYHGGIWASTLIQTVLASVYSRIASKPISRP